MPRIYGLETEFGLTCTSREGRRLSADEAARVLFKPITESYHSSNIFLPNGARLYLDVGSHPEYATAECTTLPELLAQDRAGEELMVDLAARGTRALADEGIQGELVLFKNNTDSHGNSYGTHENYLVRRVDDFGALSSALLPFLVSRQLTSGAGKLVVEPGGRPRYLLSQRAQHMLDAVSSTTTRTRPMINTRDEPHADPRLYRRMHVIVGDATMSDVTTLLKVGSMELALRVVEQGGPGVFAGLELEDPMAAIRALATDHRGRATVRLAGGGTMSGLELQEAYLEAAHGLDDLDGTLAGVLALWGRVLDALRADRLDDLATEIDWVVKLRLLERFAARHGLAPGDPRLQQLDLAYHAVTPGGVFRLLEARGAVARVTTPAAIAAAKTTPPATSRAVLRGAFVRAAEEHGREHSVDWVALSCTDLTDGTVLCTDPFATVDARVDALIERMASEPRASVPYRFAPPRG